MRCIHDGYYHRIGEKTRSASSNTADVQMQEFFSMWILMPKTASLNAVHVCPLHSGGGVQNSLRYDPIRARTKISFMFGAPLDTSSVRGAACAIINVATGFLCISRVLRACPPSSHTACLGQLVKKWQVKKFIVSGVLHILKSGSGTIWSPDPSDADMIVINGEGIIDSGTGQSC